MTHRLTVSLLMQIPKSTMTNGLRPGVRRRQQLARSPSRTRSDASLASRYIDDLDLSELGQTLFSHLNAQP